MSKIIIICMCFLCLCGCGSDSVKQTDKVTSPNVNNTNIDIEVEILDNLDKILEITDLSSSNPYDYIDNEYYNNIISFGDDAIPVLERMYQENKLIGINAYISTLAIEEITGSRNFAWTTPEEFYQKWEESKKEE